MKDAKTVNAGTPRERNASEPQPEPPPKLPALRPLPPQPRLPRSWTRLVILLIFLIGAGIASFNWWQRSQMQLPAGIAFGNGRIEADEIDVDTKFAGRIAEILADEGDTVKAGQVVARMDTRDLEVSLGKAEAQASEALRALDEANANLEQQQTLVKLAKQQLDRARFLVPKGYATQELLDQRQQQLNSAMASLNAANARIGAAVQALDGARHDVELLEVNIADNALVAPKDGRVQYRLANVGEVLPVGGKVFTMLDTSYVYMDIFLPTLQAGKVVVGADARVQLDALPKQPLPAKVTFVADQAQFTPKTVETQAERDKLMFRVRIKVSPQFLSGHAGLARAGLPGVGYVLLDANQAWPASLDSKG